MAIASKLTEAGMVAASFLFGSLSLYLMSHLPAKTKQKHIREILSQLIHFVLFMWAGKIVLNFSVFIADPLSILAFPSDSSAFYFAVFCCTVVLIYKEKQKKLDLLVFLDSFAYVFLAASFLFEFLQFMLEDNMYAFGSLLLFFVLIILYICLRKKIQIKFLLLIILSSWAFGMMILTLLLPFVTNFGYMIKPWFIGILLITIFSVYFINQKRRDT